MSTHAPLPSSNTARPWLRAALGAAALFALGGAAQAFTVNITPLSEVGQVREIRARFDEDMAPLGDARVAQMPISISCDGGSAAGSAQWATQRDLVYRLDKELLAGARCTVRLASELKSLKGSTAKGNTGPWAFNVPGPRMESVQPYGDIEEEQHFVVNFTGAPTPQSVLEHVWCAMDGVGERIPVRIIDGDERTAALRGAGSWVLRRAEKEPDRYLVLACQRRFTPGAKVRMVFGAGVAAANGTPSGKENSREWDVRAPFTASMSCERENANAPCLPIRPVRLEFSSPLPLEDALTARLKTPAGEVAPVREGEYSKTAPDSLVDWVEFKPPFPESARLTLTLPGGLKDASGRELTNAERFPLEFATGQMPPLAKFAAAPFGIVERYAEGPDGPALLPVTLRRVEPQPRLVLSSLRNKRENQPPASLGLPYFREER